jgi:hypothetical protein
MHASGCYLTNLLIAAAVAAAGCTALRTSETQLRPVGSRTAHYESAAISYRLPSAAPAPNLGDVQTASYTSGSSPAAPQGRAQFLSIEYPHPAGKKGFALAEVIVARDPSSAAGKRSDDWLSGFRRVARDRMPGLTYGEGIESAWALNVPIAEVDLLIQRLDAQGYFADAKHPAAGAELSARVNGLRFSKPWPAVPELNALVGRVRREGNLVSHREPLESLTPAQPAPVTLAVAAAPPASVAPVVATSVAAAPAAGSNGAGSQVTTALYSVPGESPMLDRCERLPPID